MARDTDQYDLFASYSTKDNENGWIKAFLEALSDQQKQFTGGRGFTYFFDKHEIRTGDDWRHRLHHALAASRVFVAFLSPNYFASRWCRREWRTWIDVEIAKHVFSDGAQPIFVVNVPGFDTDTAAADLAREIAALCNLTPDDEYRETAPSAIDQLRRRNYCQVQSFYTAGLDAIRQSDLLRILEDLRKGLSERSARIQAAAKSDSSVAPYNVRFSGRVDELLQLRERLKHNRAGVVCGISGLGGIGKTELALTYAHAFAGVYPGGQFQIPCEGRASLRDAVLVLGDQPEFGLRATEEQRKTPDTYFVAIRSHLYERLETNGPVLLLFDNVADSSLMTAGQTDALTSLGPHLHVLFTTRLAAPPRSNWMALGELPEGDAMALLERMRPFATPAERDAASQIVRRLGGFALAIELIGASLMVHEGATYESALRQVGLEDLEDIAEEPDVELRRHNHERRLSAVLGPVMDSLSGMERCTMEFAAWLPPDVVELAWLRDLVEKEMPEVFNPSKAIADPWKECYGRLIKLSLLTASATEDQNVSRVRVHRLVQQLTRLRMHPERKSSTETSVSNYVQGKLATLSETSNRSGGSRELEALESVANDWAESGVSLATYALNEVGLEWHRRATWARAEPLMRRALQIDERSFGPDHPKVGIRLNNLAQLLQDTNRLAEAEPLMRRALQIDERSFGPDHPEVAIDLNNLAALLQATNRPAEAEPLMRRALQIDERSFGPDHPEVAIDLNNLAALLQATNRPAEAEPLMRRALQIDERSFGPDHPNAAIHLNNLAQLLQDTNRLAEAEPLMRRALQIDERSFGADHPNVAIGLNNLSALLQATNRLADAEPLMRRALEIDERSFGPDHPKVAIRLNNLAQLLKATNRLAEAEPLMRRALEIDERSFGPDHPKVAIRLNNLARLLQETKRFAEAEPLMRRNVEIFLAFERKTQHRHPHFSAVLTNYFLLLQEAGETPPTIVARIATLGPEAAQELQRILDSARNRRWSDPAAPPSL